MADAPRDNLERKVAEVNTRIKELRGRRDGVGEQNTKAVLIDPILSALGWNLESLDDVSREYRRQPQDRPVDYALFLLRSPCLFIEAKGLGHDLAERKWISQILGYATVVGVEWCVLTDGDEYRLYNAHAPVDVELKLFRRVRVSDSENRNQVLDTLELLSKETMAGNRLNGLWNAHFVDRRVKGALEDLFRLEDDRLVRLLRRQLPDMKPAEIRDSLDRADFQVGFPEVSTPRSPSPPPPLLSPLPSQGTGAKEVRRAARKSPKSVGVELKDLIQAGLIKPPLPLERAYKGVTLRAMVQSDGTVSFDGVAYGSLSVSASMARKTIIGAPPGKAYPNTNGWTFWRFRDSVAGELFDIDVLRQLFLTSRH